jgi:hypothetical protein
LSKATKADQGMIRNDSISLHREQHAELYTSDGVLRLVVDHPSNARLIGTCAQARLVRAAELTVETGDGTAVVYVARGGSASRIATATAVRRASGAIGLTEWRIEPGFEHAATVESGAEVHRLTRTPGPQR